MSIAYTAFPLLLCLLVGATTAFAQEPPTDTPVASSSPSAELDPTLKATLAPELLESKLKETEAATDLDEAAKTKLAELYRKALSELQAASAFEAKATAYKDALETAPDQAKTIREALASKAEETTTDITELPADLPVAELEQQLAKVEADAAAVGAKLSELERELENSATRPTQARQAIGNAKQALDELETTSATPPVNGESKELTQARRWVVWEYGLHDGRQISCL